MREPVGVSTFEKCEDELSVTVPEPLLALYRETNGVLAPDGEYLILPLEELVETNVDMWLNHDYEGKYMPFESLLFFAYDRNDNLFAYPIVGDQADSERIFKWYCESDSRILYASGLEQYFYMRWKCYQENNHSFWDREISCKDFDDYRLFIRGAGKEQSSTPSREIGLEEEFSPDGDPPGTSMIG